MRQWTLAEDKDGSYGNKYIGNWTILDEDSRVIAIIPKTGDPEHDSMVVHANACLLSESPNILAALIRLLKWVCNPGEDDGPENDSVIAQAESAISPVARVVY